MDIYIGLVLSIFLNLFLIAKIGGKMVKGKENTVTQEEIRQMVDAGGDNGSIDENEKEMINNIFELNNISAGNIATHRTDIVAVPVEASLNDIKDVTEKEKFSRIVVYDDNIDNIVGVYHVKDMVKYLLADANGVEDGNFHLKKIMMEPYFVPVSKKVDELLEEMQLEKVHMAIVIDEYGGTAGIVTMEDIMEEIFGNIFDEYDEEEEEDILLVEENLYRINGSTDLRDVEELLQIEFEEDEDYDTLGGYLIGQLGRIPEEDESIEIPLCGWLFSVEAFEEKRIMKVLASPMPAEAAAEDAEEDNKED